ncbi:MAG: PhzF family phenazine biosynthesis protein [Chromatiales bacterium]|jgi:trans-2,3-dihydro-3-hydroxyanthranilate isomerase
MSYLFYIVDVFAKGRYSGNQLAVVICFKTLSDDVMQKIAAETNYSETTFVMPVPESDGGYRVRIFTPAREIAFAGHPILGTAWVIRQHVLPANTTTVKLNLEVGQIPVSFEHSAAGELVWFLAPPAQLGAQCEPQPMATALGLSLDDIDEAAPIQQVSAGVTATMVPVRSLDALQRSRLDLAAFAPLAQQGFAPLIYVFCRETYDPGNHLSVRFFFEAHGVREDPATGNGAAFLGTYLLQHGLFGDNKLSLRIEQGRSLQRDSLVMLRASNTDAGQQVYVGGQVVATVQGELL